MNPTPYLSTPVSNTPRDPSHVQRHLRHTWKETIEFSAFTRAHTRTRAYAHTRPRELLGICSFAKKRHIALTTVTIHQKETCCIIRQCVFFGENHARRRRITMIYQRDILRSFTKKTYCDHSLKRHVVITEGRVFDHPPWRDILHHLPQSILCCKSFTKEACCDYSPKRHFAIIY